MKKDESDKMPAYDICIIGGGINGCGIARELSAKGYQVFLAEKMIFHQAHHPGQQS